MKITRHQLRGLIREELSRVLEISSKSVADTGTGSSSSSGMSSSETGTSGKKSKSSRDGDGFVFVQLRDKIFPVLTRFYGSTLTSEDLSDQSVKSGEQVTIEFTLPGGHLTDVQSKLGDVKNALTALSLIGLKLKAAGRSTGSGDGITISVEVTVPRTL